MNRKSASVCLQPGCPELTPCPIHTPRPWEGSDRESRLPRRWKTIRARVLRRDRGICHLCGQPGSDAVDHVEPGDDHSMSNLAAVHEEVPPYCHRKKSSAEGNAARWPQPIEGGGG